MEWVKRLAWIAVFVGIGWWIFNDSGEAPPATDGKQPEDRTTTVVEDLASEYGAGSDWTDSLEGGLVRPLFSVDLQEALVDHDEPVVAVVRLADIRRTEGEWTAIFEPSLTSMLKASNVFFWTDVDEEIAVRLRENRGEKYLTEHVIVVRVSTIDRPGFTVESEIESGGGETGPPVVEFRPTVADFFIAHGELLDFAVVAGVGTDGSMSSARE